jgi:DNA-binding IclR family transcriptional regulator
MSKKSALDMAIDSGEMTPNISSYAAAIHVARRRQVSAVEIAMVLRQRVPKDELQTMTREQLVNKFNEIFASEVARFGEKLR